MVTITVERRKILPHLKYSLVGNTVYTQDQVEEREIKTGNATCKISSSTPHTSLGVRMSQKVLIRPRQADRFIRKFLGLGRPQRQRV